MSYVEDNYTIVDDERFALWVGNTIAYVTTTDSLRYVIWHNNHTRGKWPITQTEAELCVSEFADFQKFP